MEVLGAVKLLKTVGFIKDDATNTLQLADEHRREDLLRMGIEEIDAAIERNAFA